MGNNPTGKGGFGENKEHINRKGRPRSFDQLRKLAIKIANEQSPEQDDLTRLENLLRAYSNPRHPKSDKFLEYAYGKVPDKLDVTSGGEKIIVKLKSDDGS